MKTSNWIWIGAGALILFKFVGLGTAGADLNVVFNGVQFNGLTSMTLNFIVQNVTNTAITLNSIAGTVTLNDTNVGNVSSFTPVTIAPNAATPVNLDMNLSLFGAGSAIYQMINTSGTQLNFEVAGHLNANSLVLPFDVTQQISVP